MIIFCGKICKRLRKQVVFITLFVPILLTMNSITVNETVYAKDFDEESLYALAAAVTDGYNGRVLVSKKANVPLANASTTKILTCILALEKCDLKDKIKISENAACQPEVKMGLTEGEEYILEDLLYGLMLESYNDCAVAIAEHVAGDTETFSELMNKKAKEIGCSDTYFITPNGLDEDKDGMYHHTTAEDLCKIMNYCVWESEKKEDFLKITQTKEYGQFVNHNQLLGYNGVIAGKTGFTTQAGYCYVCAVEIDGKRFSIALLGSGWPNNKDYKWKDCKKLIEYTDNTYEVGKITEEFPEQSVTVKNAMIEEGDLKCWKQQQKFDVDLNLDKGEADNEMRFLKAENERLELVTNLSEKKAVDAEEIGEDLIVGTYKASINGYVLDENNLYIQSDIIPWNYKAFFKAIFIRYISKI